jgi:integrase/recombinase XerD
MKKYCSARVFLDKRRPLKNQTYPVRLRVTIKGKSNNYGLEKSMSEDDFNLVFSNAKRKPRWAADYLADFTAEQNRAVDILEKIRDLDFENFNRLFNPKSEGGNVKIYFENYIKKCKEENRHGTAYSYNNALKSFQSVVGLNNENFKDITPEWLRSYEKKMLAKEKPASQNTIGMYLRYMRAMYNQAIQDHVIPDHYYPFGKGKYQVPAGRGNKRPLQLDEIKELMRYDGPKLLYRDFFLLSYFLMGINYADLIILRWDQLRDGVLTHTRQKTKRTKKHNEPVKYVMSEKAMQIINKYGTRNNGPYMFNIIDKADDDAAIFRKKINFISATGKALKSIARDININENISTVFARHTAASIAHSKGTVSLNVISETLGHTSLQTTAAYLSSLGLDEKKSLSDALDF